MTRQISYDRNSLKCGILHIGVGNFHRAHEAWFTDRLIASDPTQCDWGDMRSHAPRQRPTSI